MSVYTPVMTAHEDKITAMKFMKGLKSGYRQFVEYYEHGIKDWPDTLDEAYLEMTTLTPKKPTGTGLPNQTNIFAVKTAGG